MFNVVNCKQKQEEKEEAKPNAHPFANYKQEEKS